MVSFGYISYLFVSHTKMIFFVNEIKMKVTIWNVQRQININSITCRIQYE